MIKSYDTRDLKRWNRTYHEMLNLDLDSFEYVDEARRKLNSAKKIPGELRDTALNERIKRLEKMLALVPKLVIEERGYSY